MSTQRYWLGNFACKSEIHANSVCQRFIQIALNKYSLNIYLKIAEIKIISRKNGKVEWPIFGAK